MKKVVRTLKLAAIVFTPLIFSSQCRDLFCVFNPGSILCINPDQGGGGET